MDVLTKRRLAQMLKSKHLKKHSHQFCSEFINSFFNEITKAISNEEEVKLSGFGKFSIREKLARTGMNFSTGKKITIAGRKSVVFKSSRNLKSRVADLGAKQPIASTSLETEVPE